MKAYVKFIGALAAVLVVGFIAAGLMGAADLTSYNRDVSFIRGPSWTLYPDSKIQYFGTDSDVASQWTGSAWTIVPLADATTLDFGSTSYGFKIRQRKATDEFATSGSFRISDINGNVLKITSTGAISNRGTERTSNSQTSNANGIRSIVSSDGNANFRGGLLVEGAAQIDGNITATTGTSAFGALKATDVRSTAVSTSNANGKRFIADSDGNANVRGGLLVEGASQFDGAITATTSTAALGVTTMASGAKIGGATIPYVAAIEATSTTLVGADNTTFSIVLRQYVAGKTVVNLSLQQPALPFVQTPAYIDNWRFESNGVIDGQINATSATLATFTVHAIAITLK